MSSAILPILGDVAGALVGGIFNSGSTSAPAVVAAPEAPTVLDTNAQAADEANTEAQAQKKKAQQIAAAQADLNKPGSLNVAPSKRTLLGD